MTDQNRTVTIDGTAYQLDVLSESARMQLGNIKAVDAEIRRMDAQLAIYKTARAAYARVLKGELSNPELAAH